MSAQPNPDKPGIHFTITILALAALLGGCSSFRGTFENRLACSLDGAEVYFVSKYGWIGISAEASGKDAPFVCSAKVRPAP
jgi:hypothetical protein